MSPPCDRTQYLLECLVESENLDGLLSALVAIAEKNARSPYSDKLAARQWTRTLRRLRELREWCVEFGPGSGCR